MHRLTATDTPMVRYTRTIFPSYALILHEAHLLLYFNSNFSFIKFGYQDFVIMKLKKFQ